MTPTEMKILAIDDNKDALGALGAALAKTFPGAAVFTAPDAAGGIRLALAEEPDVILLDVVMPGMDGFEACRSLKAEPRLADIPVLLMTVLAPEAGIYAKALEAGAEALLHKPLELGEVLVQVRAMAKIRAAATARQKEKERLETMVAERTGRLEAELAEHKRTEAAVLESETRYRTLFEQARDSILLLELPPEGIPVIRDANEAALRLHGFTREELLGKPITFLEKEGSASLGRGRAARIAPDGGAVFEARHRRKDGSAFHVEVSAKEMTVGGKRLLLDISRDITARISAERELRASEELFRKVFSDHSAVKLILAPDTGNILDANDAAARFYGWPREQLLRMRIQDINTLPHEEIKKKLEQVRANDRMHFEFRHRLADGAVRDVEVFSSVIEVKGRELLHSVIHDITDRKKVEAALTESEERYRRLFEAAKDGILLLDFETGKITGVNPFMTELLGYSKEVFLEKHLWEVGVFRDVVSSKNAFRQLKTLGYIRYEDLPLMTKDGKRAAVEFVSNVYQVGSKKVIQCNIRDITERKRAHEQLQKSESRYRSLFGNMLNGFAYCRMIYEGDKPADFVYLAVNGAFEKLTGLKDVTGKRVTEVLPGIRETDAALLESYGRVARTGAPESFEIRVEALKMWFAISVYSPAKDHFVAVFDVITERKLLESRQALAGAVLKCLADADKSEDVIRDILDNVRESTGIGAAGIRLKAGEDYPYYLVDGFPEEFVLNETSLCSRQADGKPARDATGVTRLECMCGDVIRGRTDPDLPFFTRGGSFWTNSTTDLLADPASARTLAGARNRCNKAGYESLALIPLRSRDTIIGLLQLNDRRRDRFTPDMIEFFESLGSSIGIAFERRTRAEEKLQLEEQFRQSQKMEAVGLLAGGVAHDFNNILSAIMCYAEFLARDLEPGDPRLADAKEISAAAERAASLTRQLLAFSRRQILASKIVDINWLMGGMTRLLTRTISENIRLAVKLHPEPCLADVDPGQVEQVILNLAVNARDAMPEGGTLTLKTEILRPPEEFFTAKPDLARGPLVCLSVSDTGCGMTEEVKRRLFEPFFTTKEQGKGTGLGLSMVFGIVKQSRGEIAVESEPGKGTVFSIYLPFAKACPLDTEKEMNKDNKTPAKGVETVLFVEDEASLRRLGERVLRAAGYAVLAAADGQEALKLMEERGRPVDLLLTDVVMPGLSGRELALELARRKLAGRVLYMSGYTDDAIVKHGVLEPGIAFIYKPFTMAAVTLKLREVLDGPADQARA